MNTTDDSAQLFFGALIMIAVSLATGAVIGSSCEAKSGTTIVVGRESVVCHEDSWASCVEKICPDGITGVGNGTVICKPVIDAGR